MIPKKRLRTYGFDSWWVVHVKDIIILFSRMKIKIKRQNVFAYN